MTSQKIWVTPILKKGVWVSVIFFGIIFFGALFSFGRVPPEIPLQYSRPWGQDQLAPKSALWLLIGGGAAVMLVHLTLASLLFKKDQLSAQVVIWTGVFILFFLILSVFTIYLRVGLQIQ